MRAAEEDRMISALSALENGFQESLQSLADGLQRSLTDPIRETFRVAAEAHRRIVEEASFPPSPGEEAAPHQGMRGASPPVQGAADLWARASVYRSRVQAEVLEPLQDALRQRNGASDLENEIDTFKRALIRLAASLPEEVSRPEPPQLYLSREGDSLTNSIGKGIVRSRRRIGAWSWQVRQLLRRPGGKASLELPGRSQTVPFRELVERSIEGPYTLAVETFREQLHQYFARPLADLETAAARWTQEWHPLEWMLEKEARLVQQSLEEALSRRFARIAVGEAEEGAEPAGQKIQPTSSVPAPLSPSSVAGVLSRGLEAGEGLDGPGPILEALDGTFQREWSNLLARVEVSGSFMPSIPPSRMSVRAHRLEEGSRERDETWGRWHRSAPNRLALAIHLCSLRGELDQARERLVRSVGEESLLPLLEKWEESSLALIALEERSVAAFSDSVSSSRVESLSVEVAELLEEGLKVLSEAVVVPLGPGGVEDDIHGAADGVSTDLARTLGRFPDSIPVQALQVHEGIVNPDSELREIPLREICQQVLDVLRLEALRNGANLLLAVLSTAREEAEGLPDVLRFNLEAAAAELTQASSTSPHSIMEEAGSLTREGLTRTQAAVGRFFQGMPEAWTAFATTARDLLGSAFQEVHARTSMEGGVQDQILGFEAQLRLWRRTGVDRVRSAGSQWSGSGQRTIRRAGVRVLRVIRLGRKAVGAAPSEGGEGDWALKVISQAPELLSALPLVYRRLFSFQPLTDKDLLKGRSSEMTWVRSRLESWKAGMGAPNLLTGPVGAGHTSFFNVLASSMFGEAKVHRLELTERIRTEEPIASRVAQLLGYSDNEPWSFQRLARMVSTSRGPSQPWIVLTERLEHLVLRTPGGTELIGDFLSFQAQTSHRVFWLSSMAGASWKLVANTERRAAALVNPRPLSPPSREVLVDLILTRHRRSGLPLEFGSPSDPNPILRRRLRRARGEKPRQALLQTEFFDRLYRLSQESIPMAILHWLRAADFQSREGKLLVIPPPPVSFAFLDDLDLELDFALKAFLEHGTLTLEEYREVFAASEEESYQIFEALRSRMLVEPVGARGGIIPTSRKMVEEGARYRTPALLSQVVAQRLKNRNILH